MQQDFQFGLRNGKIVHAESVESGLKCNCYCPSCGGRFIAYKGSLLRPHFKHQVETKCRYSFETSLHYLAKEIIQQKRYLHLPALTWALPIHPSAWFACFENEEPPLEEMKEWKKVYFDKVEVEQWEGNFMPDLKCYAGGKELFIEITVTHGIDERKLNKIKEKNIPLLEINLSSLQHDISKRTLTRELYKAKTAQGVFQHFKWVHNPKNEVAYLQQQERSESILKFLKNNYKPVKLYGRNNEIYRCPLLRKETAPYKFADTCAFCFYNLGKFEIKNDTGGPDPSKERAVLCIGHKKQELEWQFKENGVEQLILGI